MIDDKELFEQSREEEQDDGVHPLEETQTYKQLNQFDKKHRRIISNALTIVTSKTGDSGSAEHSLEDYLIPNLNKNSEEPMNDDMLDRFETSDINEI